MRTKRTKKVYSRKEKTQGDHSSYFYMLKKLDFRETRINGLNNSPTCVDRSVAYSAYYVPGTVLGSEDTKKNPKNTKKYERQT